MYSHKLTCLFVVVAGLAGHVSAALPNGPVLGPSDPANTPTLPTYTWPGQADWELECHGRAASHSGDLVIDHPSDGERYRCVRTVWGDVEIDSALSKHMILPWLQFVAGNLKLQARGTFPKARLPRLHHVSGKITVDFWTGFTRFELPALVDHVGTLRVIGGTSSDLSGLDALADLGTLELYTKKVNAPQNPQFPTYKGLAGLLSVGSLDLDVDGEESDATPDFLSSLVEVRNSAEIRVKYELIGLGAVQTIGGSLTVHVDNLYGTSSAAGLESLSEVGGHFRWKDTDLTNVSALSNLAYVGGDLDLPLDVTSLYGLHSLAYVGGNFKLGDEVDVANLFALSALQHVGGKLTIESSGVQSLAGLDSVAHLGSLRIHANPQLGNVAALTGATVGSGGSVVITNNAPLTNCQANTLANSLIGSFTKTVSGNQACTIVIGPKIDWPLR